MNRRDELIEKLYELDFPHDDFCDHDYELIANFVLERERKILAEVEKPLKELKLQFDYMCAYQQENLGKSLKEAEENWDSMLNPGLDFGKLNEALAIINRYKKGE